MLCHLLPQPPTIFIPNDKNNDLDFVLLEQYPDFDIYWYHWPHDGPAILGEEDYEPIVVIYKNNEICCVVSRLHWTYKFYDLKQEELYLPVEVLFETGFHGPLVRSKRNEVNFQAKKVKLVARNYSPKAIVKSGISDKFRIGKGHMTKIRGTVEDPATTAVEAHNYYCI